ncbi:MAG: hypothetical protein KME35_08480 [Aphanocapsa sp. GSE-SYN-MK-11-07L]|jgi:hypothetical protein|nr:hypothetical protein [Aphanocapsa sp. GSE-SYN-MK-11-07L]
MKHFQAKSVSNLLGSTLIGLAVSGVIFAPEAKAISIVNWQNQALDSVPTSITENGITSTFSYTGAFTVTTPRVDDSHSDSLVAGVPARALRLTQLGPSIGSFTTTTVNFSIALDVLTLEIFDVDARRRPFFTSGDGFTDVVNLQGFDDRSGTVISVTPTLTLKGTNPGTRPTVAGTTATGQLRIFDNPIDSGGGTNPPGDDTNDATEATVIYSFSAPVTSLTFTYRVGDPGLPLAQQTVALGNIRATPVPFPSSPLGLLFLGAVAAYKKFRLSQK